uniref:DYW domain-containing protein n=1 Tax=Kalanchoe fedtschenkoi TaxID=63787 RepID=A0A7N0SZZ9_KALFE
MSRRLPPSSFTPAIALVVRSTVDDISSCASVNACMAIHARVIKHLNYTHGFAGDRLVSVYMRMGMQNDALKLFDELPQKDLVSWNSLITGLSRVGCFERCLSEFLRMKLQVGLRPNDVTLLTVLSACGNIADNSGRYLHGCGFKIGLLSEPKVINSLINLYGKFGQLDAAHSLFQSMLLRNVVSWNLMVTVNVQNGQPEEAVRIFHRMREDGNEPDEATAVAVLQACTDIGSAKLAEAIHGYLVICGLDTDMRVATGLLNLYAKLGRLEAACYIFVEIKKSDRIAWTAMIAAYSVHGNGKEAIRLFELMICQGIQPDHVTFTHLLSACSHSGLVKEGKELFDKMFQVFGVTPILDHYSCMVDLLGRSGLVNEAWELIKQMPVEPNAAVLGALLNACRIYRNTNLGKIAAERLIDLDPSDPRNYIMLFNIYSAAGLRTEASKTRSLMKSRKIIPIPGCSFIEHQNKIHQFVVGDQAHRSAEKIHMKLEEVISKVRSAGLAPITEFVLQDVEEDVKEDMINQHSEKLAIAFGLLVTCTGMPLFIIKNLRICQDCHGFAKAVSFLEKRKIIIRDSKRFHHFEHGLCSCGDYW